MSPSCRSHRFHTCWLWRRQSRFHGLEIVEKNIETPELQTVQGTQTFESLDTAPVRRMIPAEIEVVEIGAPLPTESASPMFVTAPVLEAPPVCCGVCRPSCYPVPSRTRCWAQLEVLRLEGNQGLQERCGPSEECSRSGRLCLENLRFPVVVLRMARGRMRMYVSPSRAGNVVKWV